MSSKSVDLRDSLYDLVGDISPLDKDLLFLFSAGLSSEEIAERTVYPVEYVDDRGGKLHDQLQMVNIVYIDELSSIDWRQVSDFDTFEMSDLSVVAERVLEHDKNYVSASEISDAVNQTYDRDMDNGKAGRKLRILGEEFLEKDELKEEYSEGGNTKKWKIKYLRDNHLTDILNLINENISESEFKYNLDENKQKVDTTNQNVVEAYKQQLSSEISEYSAEGVLDYLETEDPDLDALNKQLHNSGKETFQVSRITENAGGWAPDAVNPQQVEVENDDFYGKTAIIKRQGKGPSDKYTIEKILD